MTRFADWPQWLQTLVLVPHGILASVACWWWWPKSDKEWRKFGFVAAYLIAFTVEINRKSGSRRGDATRNRLDSVGGIWGAKGSPHVCKYDAG
jgi:hypothetical protein